MIVAIETSLTIAFAGVALLAAVAFVLFRQPVYSALSFATAVLAAAGLYILQDAAYVAAATMVIYAGATIIIFLFVLMFAQHSHLQAYELKYSNLGVAFVASLCLTLLLGYAVTTRGQVAGGPQQMVIPPSGSAPTSSPQAKDSRLPSESKVDSEQSRAVATKADASVAALGRVTYTRYLWSIELAGTLLLIAAGGAIIIAHREPHAIQSTGVHI
jgi:NADH-quinone oxidoreductase subunit J